MLKLTFKNKNGQVITVHGKFSSLEFITNNGSRIDGRGKEFLAIEKVKMMTEIKSEFSSLLELIGEKQKFIKNIKMQCKDLARINRRISMINNQRTFAEALCIAFEWDVTPQGFIHWKQIHERFA